ncbi:hypothetical protein DI09_490p10, partial [Mitosporidium daphniae]
MISALDENYNSVAYCFMDVKGLRFFLPVLLTLGYFGAIEIWMEYIVEEQKTTTNEKYKEMWNGLSFDQKICFLECMEQNFLLEADFIFEYKNSICDNCDAKQYVYDGNAEFYQLVLKLKEITIKNEKAGIEKMNRNTTEIVSIDNQVVLKRFYKKGFHELGSHFFHLPEMPSD